MDRDDVITWIMVFFMLCRLGNLVEAVYNSICCIVCLCRKAVGLLSSLLWIILNRAHRLDQQQKDSALKNQFLPISTHWAKQMYKIIYWHQYTIDAVQSFTVLRRTVENFKNMFKYCYNNVSFALLNGWNVTKTSFDYASAGTKESCLWTQRETTMNIICRKSRRFNVVCLGIQRQSTVYIVARPHTPSLKIQLNTPLCIWWEGAQKD